MAISDMDRSNRYSVRRALILWVAFSAILWLTAVLLAIRL